MCSLIEENCDRLGYLMVSNNNAAYETAFTVSVDLLVMDAQLVFRK